MLAAGCGGGSRVPIKGTVTYKNTPVANGWITFVPKDGTKGTQKERTDNRRQISNPGRAWIDAGGIRRYDFGCGRRIQAFC